MSPLPVKIMCYDFLFISQPERIVNLSFKLWFTFFSCKPGKYRQIISSCLVFRYPSPIYPLSILDFCLNSDPEKYTFLCRLCTSGRRMYAPLHCKTYRPAAWLSLSEWETAIKITNFLQRWISFPAKNDPWINRNPGTSLLFLYPQNFYRCWP